MIVKKAKTLFLSLFLYSLLQMYLLKDYFRIGLVYYCA